MVFTPAGGGLFLPSTPSGDGSTLQFQSGGSDPDSLTLTRHIGTNAFVTTWIYDTTGATPDWFMYSSDGPGTSNDVDVRNVAGRPTWIRESEPDAASACTPQVQTTGCRALLLTYTVVGTSTRLTSVSRQIGAASQAAVDVTVLATYSYDTSGRLTSACTGTPSVGKPEALRTPQLYGRCRTHPAQHRDATRPEVMEVRIHADRTVPLRHTRAPRGWRLSLERRLWPVGLLTRPARHEQGDGGLLGAELHTRPCARGLPGNHQRRRSRHH